MIVAIPKLAGIGRYGPSGEIGAAPKITPSTAPTIAEPTRTESALR
jgi:hypothetical protein